MHLLLSVFLLGGCWWCWWSDEEEPPPPPGESRGEVGSGLPAPEEPPPRDFLDIDIPNLRLPLCIEEDLPPCAPSADGGLEDEATPPTATPPAPLSWLLSLRDLRKPHRLPPASDGAPSLLCSDRSRKWNHDEEDPPCPVPGVAAALGEPAVCASGDRSLPPPPSTLYSEPSRVPRDWGRPRASEVWLLQEEGWKMASQHLEEVQFTRPPLLMLYLGYGVS